MLGGDISQLLRSFALPHLGFQKPLGEPCAPAPSPSVSLAPMAPKKAKGKAIAAASTSRAPPAEECGPDIVGTHYSADVEEFRWAGTATLCPPLIIKLASAARTSPRLMRCITLQPLARPCASCCRCFALKQPSGGQEGLMRNAS